MMGKELTGLLGDDECLIPIDPSVIISQKSLVGRIGADIREESMQDMMMTVRWWEMIDDLTTINLRSYCRRPDQ